MGALQHKTISLFDLSLDVSYYFYPEEAPFLSGTPEDCYEGHPAEVEIEDVLIEGTGVSIYELLRSTYTHERVTPWAGAYQGVMKKIEQVLLETE